MCIIKKYSKENINYLAYTTTTIIVAFHNVIIACELGLEINIGFMGIKIQYGGDMLNKPDKLYDGMTHT